MTSAPAGWYPQSDGGQRYWDGERWTEHFAPGAGGHRPSPPAAGATVPTAAQRPWFKKKRFIIPAALVGLIIIGSSLGGGGDAPNESTALDSSSSSQEPAVEDAAESPTPATTTKSPTPPASKAAKPDNTPKIGSKVRDGKFEFVVTGMKCGIDQVGGQYLNTKAQGEFCRVTMNITNVGDQAQTMFAGNQTAFDAKNRKFSADSEASIYDSESEVLFEEINPGNTVKGRVYFDVPKGAELVKIELHDSAFSGGVDVALKK